MEIAASPFSADPYGDPGLSLTGVLDLSTAPAFGTAVAELGPVGDVRVDLRGVEFADSSGLRALIEVHVRLASTGRRLLLVGLSPHVRGLLEVTGLFDHLHVTPVSRPR